MTSNQIYRHFRSAFVYFLFTQITFLGIASAGPSFKCQSLFIAVPNGGLFKGLISEKGNYEWSEKDIERYFESHPETQGMIKLVTPEKELRSYKVNKRGELQARNWYEYYSKLKSHQHRWSLDIEAFIKSWASTTFNEAKKKFYSKIKFNKKTNHYEMPFFTMKEWGELNHPPLKSLSSEKLEKYSKNYKKIDYESPSLDSSNFFNPNFHRKVDQITGTELTINNKFRLLEDNKTYHERIKIIKNAKKSIWVSSLVFINDKTTRDIADLLIKKSMEGIDVRVIVEKSLSYIHPQLVNKMKKSKVKIILADDLLKHNGNAIYHIKLLLADGNIAITGGQNMLDANLGSKGTDFKNRDLDIRTTGPVVADMALEFMQNWNHFVNKRKLVFRNNQKQEAFLTADFQNYKDKIQKQREQGLRGSNFYSSWFNNRQQRMNGISRYIGQKPYDEKPYKITDAYEIYLNQVQNYLGMTSALALSTFTNPKKANADGYYKFKNYNRLHNSLQTLLKDKVNVDIITSNADFALNEAVPMTMDRINKYVKNKKYLSANLNQLFIDLVNPIVAKKHFKNLKNDYLTYSNVSVWLHTSFIHSKVILFDRIAASIGSFNWHHNASDQAYESTLMIQDKHFMKELDRAMVLDMANSAPLMQNKY